jgi:hypothetical protein
MENSVRYQRLEGAVYSVYIDRLFGHGDQKSLKEVRQAAVELNLNYEGGNIIDAKGQVSSEDVSRLMWLAGRLHAGEDSREMEYDLKEFLRPLLDADIHA